MTGAAVRDTQFASWIDPDAWMEKMRGPKWNAVLKDEEDRVQKILSKAPVKKRIGPFLTRLLSASDANITIPFECGSIDVYWHSQFIKTWRFKDESTLHEARDIVCKHNSVWTTKDIGNGAESFELRGWCAKSWKIHPVGPDIGIVGDRLYYLGVKNKLIYHELWSCDALTGQNKKLVYSEKNPNVNLSLEKQPDGRLLLVCDNSQDTEYFKISENNLIRQKRFLIPRSWRPPRGEYGIEFVWKTAGIMITKRHGIKTLWHYGSQGFPKKILEIPAGQIQIDPYNSWGGSLPCTVRVSAPNQNTVFYSIDKSATFSLLNPVQPAALVSKRFGAKSNDGTDVYGILTYKSFSEPKYLLMIGYGAYGIETGIGPVLKRWAPLVEAGWAIGHTFIRGGGDHTDEWGKVGRIEGRTKTIDDFCTLVKMAQSILKISPKSTAIYGRSAGGLLIGGTLKRYPDGTLMQVVYTEVPYVDELRTTTNPSLPLTELEYNEFGNPSKYLEDFVSVGVLSPTNSAKVVASPTIFVLTRTAENDSQVFAYESVKWIRRLREHDKKGDAPKLCIVDKDQGHFTSPDKTEIQWATDCAILDAWIKREL